MLEPTEISEANKYRCTGKPRYMREIGTAYNEFTYKKTKDTYKLGDRFRKNSQFSIAHMQIHR